MTDFLTALKNQAIVLDGAMGTMIQDLHLTDSAFGGGAFRMLSDLLTLSRPEKLRDIHLAYYRAGSNAVETNTFGASPFRLEEYDFSKIDLSDFAPMAKEPDLRKATLEQIAYLLNRRSAEVAAEARDQYRQEADYDGRPLFVIGSVGPSNRVLSQTRADLKRATYTQVRDNFTIQVQGLIDGGADVILFETQQDQLELKAAVHGALQAMRDRKTRLPIMAQVTVDPYGKMQIFNTDILAALTTVAGIGVDVFGINCSIGPDLMLKTVERLSEYCPLPISVIPNAGLPVSENGKTVFKTSPETLASYAARFVSEYGVNVVGGCCGTRPDHIAKMSAAVKNLTPKVRKIASRIFVSGPQNAIEFESKSGLIRIAERLNVRGSKKVKDAVEGTIGKIDFDALEEVMNEQVRDLGAPIIDVCLDSNLVDTKNTLVKTIEHISTDFPGAMCLDSFAVDALLAATESYSGRPIINSISLEEVSPGVDKIDAVVAPTREHDPIYVALATGPKGPGASAEEKFELAKEIFEKCRDNYGLRADQLIVDVNAFPIGSESDDRINFAAESLRAIPMVKSIDSKIKVSMGVGNLTTGLGKKTYMRKLLTSVFVSEARKVGLDAAIINPDHYVPTESLPPADVALALQVIHDHDMDAFAKLEEIALAKTTAGASKKISYDDLPLEEAICRKIKDGFKQRVTGTITATDGYTYTYQDAIVVQVAEALKKYQPLDFVNQFLMAAMKDLGDGFGRGEVSLPHLLKSADVMKHAMGYVEDILRHRSGAALSDVITYKGTVVIGTVYQDVHSIGKDLVKTLLENYGYRVIDLGVQTPLELFVETAREQKADAIGMSALLVQTSNHMIAVAKMLQDAGLGHVDILIGGAPVNPRHAAAVSLYGQDDPEKMLANVFYCATGMDGVNIMNALRESPEKRKFLYEDNLKKLKWHRESAERRQNEEKRLLSELPRRSIAAKIPESVHVLKPTLLSVSLAELKPHLDLKTLFSLNWRFGGKSSWEKKGTSEDQLKAMLDDWVVRCDREAWLKPQALCAVFPCRAVGDCVEILNPEQSNQVLAAVPFDVVIGAGQKDIFSAAPFFAGNHDSNGFIGLQISTGGVFADKQIEKFKADHDTESAHYLQGLADRVAEDMAQYAHAHLRKVMELSSKIGTRYSPGYPALRSLSVNKILADLLGANDLAIRLTEAGEFDPPGTTGAVVSFYPEATYE